MNTKKSRQLQALASQVKTITASAQGGYNRFVNDDYLPKDVPEYINVLYINLQLKLIDLLQASSLLGSALKNYSKKNV